MGIYQVYGAQSIPADKIETTPTATDLIEVRDATNTNDATAISIVNAVKGLVGAVQYDEVFISAADVVATGAGKLGHAAGQILVAGQTGKIVEFISGTLIYDYAGGGFASGGNITFNLSGGGAALTGLISAANSLGATSDKVVGFVPLAVAGLACVSGAGINLVSSAAFTAGSATGVVRVKVAYRVHTTDL